MNTSSTQASPSLVPYAGLRRGRPLRSATDTQQAVAETVKAPDDKVDMLRPARSRQATPAKVAEDLAEPGNAPTAPHPSIAFAIRALHRSRQIAQRWRTKKAEQASLMNPVSEYTRRFGDRSLRLEGGSITDAKVAAVVTAANEGLRGGAGVDQAVHTAAGPDLLGACRAIGHCPAGSAVVTPAFALEENGVQRIIHAVGPIWYGGEYGEVAKLQGAYRTSLNLADAEGCKSIAFPAISCGVYGFPVDQAARIALETVAEHLRTTQGAVEQVTFVLFDKLVFEAFATALADMDETRAIAS